MHTWSEHLRIYTTHGTILTYRDRYGEGGLPVGPEIALGAGDAEPILCAEVLRLAQREADLLAQVGEREGERDAWKRTAEACSDAVGKHLVRIAKLEEEKADRIAIADEMGRGYGAMAAESGRAQQRIKALEFDLAAAKRANEILGGKVNGLEGDVQAWKANHAHQRRRIAALERENRDKTLELAEKAEEIRKAHAACEDTELARRAGLAEVRSLDEIRGRLARLEIGKETASFRADGIDDRLVKVESRGKDHAVLLTDHADRLKALEFKESEIRGTVYQEFTRRLDALDAGKE